MSGLVNKSLIDSLLFTRLDWCDSTCWEDVSVKIVDIVAVTDDRVEEKIDDRLVTVDSSATASQKLVTVWLQFLNFWPKSGLFHFFAHILGPLCLGRCLHIGWVYNLMGFVRQRAGRRSAPILVISGQWHSHPFLLYLPSGQADVPGAIITYHRNINCK